MNLDKEGIKNWLKHHGKDREWLGAQTGKALHTINNWLSTSKQIPDGMMSVIARVFAAEEATEAQRAQLHNPTNHLFSVQVDRETFNLFNEASVKAQQAMEAWAITELTLAANEALGSKESLREQPPSEDDTKSYTDLLKEQQAKAS